MWPSHLFCSFSSSCWHTSSCWLGLVWLLLHPSQSLYISTSGIFAKTLLCWRGRRSAWTHASMVRMDILSPLLHLPNLISQNVYLHLQDTWIYIVCYLTGQFSTSIPEVVIEDTIVGPIIPIISTFFPQLTMLSPKNNYSFFWFMKRYPITPLRENIYILSIWEAVLSWFIVVQSRGQSPLWLWLAGIPLQD